MKGSHWQRVGVALYAAIVMGVSVPAVAGAQQPSPASPQPGVQPVQLPRTGNPEAGNESPWLPIALLGGGLVAAGVLVRGRRQHGARN